MYRIEGEKEFREQDREVKVSLSFPSETFHIDIKQFI